jgi:hypothetical protein
MDILFGSPRLREALEAGIDADEIARQWPAGAARFMEARTRCLLYS